METNDGAFVKKFSLSFNSSLYEAQYYDSDGIVKALGQRIGRVENPEVGDEMIRQREMIGT